MLDDFQQLGGKAENIVQRVGQFGNGIFPIDPGQPITIAVPPHLLIDGDHMVLDGDDLVVSPDSGIATEVRAFIARYQKVFSWGSDGRKHVESFELALKTLPEPLLVALGRIGLLNLSLRHEGEWIEVIKRRFIQSRHIRYEDRRVIMPIIELINHNPHGPSYDVNKGIRFSGQFCDEVTVNYSSTSDSLIRFFNYGFANPEPIAYSLPIVFKSDNGTTIEVACETSETEKINGLPLPKVNRTANNVRLSYLRLGLEAMPRMPRTMMRAIFPERSYEQTDELFDRIRNANQLALCELLELADGETPSTLKDFRHALLFQLRALTYCFGARELTAPL